MVVDLNIISQKLARTIDQENKFLSRKCLPSYRQMLTEISGYSSLNCYLAIKAYVNTSSMPRALQQSHVPDANLLVRE